MTAFTKDEQWDHNYQIYLADKDGKLARFDHVGWRLLPPTIAKSKEKWLKVTEYFERVNSIGDYTICPNLLKHLDMQSVVNYDEYIKDYGRISSKGLYSYDSDDFSFKERPYFRITLPKKELLFEDLPQEIREILEKLRMSEIDFSNDSLIREKIVAEL